MVKLIHRKTYRMVKLIYRNKDIGKVNIQKHVQVDKFDIS